MKGKIRTKLPYAGLIVLYLHSQIGRITVSVAVTLLIVNSYSKELDEAKKKLGQKVFSPVLKEQRQVQGALNKLASATLEYAQNLESHTKAVKDLAVTTEKLRNVVERLERTQRKQGEKN